MTWYRDRGAEEARFGTSLERAAGLGAAPALRGASAIERSPSHHVPTLSDDGDGNGDNERGPGTGLAVKPRVRTKRPSMYKVLMLNDDYTPMEFVVHVLERFFAKSNEDATRIMLHVHQRGVGICGVFTYEVAETKVSQVMDLARQHQHPLQCTIEKDSDGEED